MTIQTFIEKAIEGGWSVWDTIRAPHTSSEKFDSPRCGDCFCQAFTLHTHVNLDEKTYEILLDPEAWKAVGKVSGWNENYDFTDIIEDGIGYKFGYDTKMPTWECMMHRMIDSLAEGKSIEFYLETL
jgi:hypothetical protein